MRPLSQISQVLLPRSLRLPNPSRRTRKLLQADFNRVRIQLLRTAKSNPKNKPLPPGPNSAASAGPLTPPFLPTHLIGLEGEAPPSCHLGTLGLLCGGTKTSGKS